MRITDKRMLGLVSKNNVRMNKIMMMMMKSEERGTVVTFHYHVRHQVAMKKGGESH